MKMLIRTILFLFLSGHLSAQEKLNINHKYSENKVLVLNLTKVLKTQVEPSFKGLFQKDFNQIEQSIKWQNIFDDYDVGVRFGFVIPMNQKLNIKTRYLFGLLNFDKRGLGQAEGYQFQLCISYNL